MLSRSKRLTTEQYQRAFDKGTLNHSTKATLRLLFVSGEDVGSSLWAVNVPKKVSKLAVVRNKIRRQTFEAIHDILKSDDYELQASDERSAWAIIIWKPTVLDATYEQIIEYVEELMIKAGIIVKRG
ncbi:MAG: ribonuclease P protein component [Patescibacteria group bacterium]